VLTGGIPESIVEPFDGWDAIVDEMVRQTMHGRAATLDDVGNVAAFAASEMPPPVRCGAAGGGAAPAQHDGSGLDITCSTEVH
jgi:hypothetical protein